VCRAVRTVPCARHMLTRKCRVCSAVRIRVAAAVHSGPAVPGRAGVCPGPRIAIALPPASDRMSLASHIGVVKMRAEGGVRSVPPAPAQSRRAQNSECARAARRVAQRSSYLVSRASSGPVRSSPVLSSSPHSALRSGPRLYGSYAIKL
jgi:hypothetical protein